MLSLGASKGELAALLTAVFWTITALAFESASKKVGSLAVNLIRLCLAFLFLSVFGFFTGGSFLPLGATSHQWIWLSVSGLVGFVLGDLFLFQAYVVVGARISMLIMALAPPIAALTGWLLMDETMSAKNLAGMVLTFVGISMAILARKAIDPEDFLIKPKRGKLGFKYPIKGLLLAFGGAAGQGIGLVLSKYGMGQYDPFAATQIRVITGVVGFILIIVAFKASGKVLIALKNSSAMKRLSLGAFFGPFLGVSFSLIAVQYTSSGIASTIMSIVPVLIIVPSVFIMKEKITWQEIAGAFIAVAGVSLFFI
ncbi:MAG: EamA family transporter [Bacteroidetes bacterium HGW-Bacteroidetes-11]|nr:MAG: EamA family transporter [Bacteroidetes bacterium HGW-Bacteroidetes-11]